jgi:glutathione S-transferase
MHRMRVVGKETCGAGCLSVSECALLYHNRNLSGRHTRRCASVTMKLHYAETSPFVHKVMLVAHECGLADQLDLRPTAPDTIIADVSADNPLGQIPTLVTDDGTVIYDSGVIMEYLDHSSGGGLLPEPGPARWRVLRNQALGQGMITAINLRYNETRRPADEQSPAWITKKDVELGRACDALEAMLTAGEDGPGLSDEADFGSLTIACALAYASRRWSEGNWSTGRPALTAWYTRFAGRPSMQATMP